MKIIGLGVNNRISQSGGISGRIGSSAIIVVVVVNTINPFAATASPPSGYQFIAGAISINIDAKLETFGVSSVVSGAITTSGLITENTAGQVQTAIQAGGWIEGDDVIVSVTGAMYDVYVSPGPVVALASVSRVGSPTNATTIVHSAVPVAMPPRDLVAFYLYRGPGSINTNQFTFNAVTMTQVATAVNVQTSGWTGARRLTNPNNVASGNVSITGVSSSTSNSSTVALLSVNDSDLFSMVTNAPAGSVTSADATVSVLPGDVLVSIVNCFGAAGALGTVTWTGTSEISASAQCGTQSSYSAVAMQTISSTNAAYVVGSSWALARSNCTHSVLRIRKA